MSAPGDAALREALEWLVRLQDEKAGPDLQARFSGWLSAHAQNRHAWDDAQRLWSDLDMVRSETEVLRRPSRRRVLGGLVAVAVGGAGIYGGIRAGRTGDVATAVGETRDIALPNGVAVALGSRSAIALAGSGVTLLGGEAFFTVPDTATDAFAVTAMQGTVRTRGARFNMRWTGDRIEVAVADRGVDLRGPTGGMLGLRAGWRVDYGLRDLSAPLEADVRDIGAWREGRLVFRDTALSTVLAEIERWRGGHITLLDRSAGRIPVTAIFDTADPQAALVALARTLDLRMTNLPGHITLLRG